MKPRDISHWERNQYFFGLLLFVETIEEATSYYSFESYRRPALNCHFMCYDVQRTAMDIQKKILMDGNFVPISEEFEHIIKEDLFIISEIGESKIILCHKGKDKEYFDTTKNDLRSKINEYRILASYIENKCSTQNSYLYFLRNRIINDIFNSQRNYDTEEEIYQLARMIVTELTCNGYSQEYIYLKVQECFYDSEVSVECNESTLQHFFSLFNLKNKKYTLKFAVNKKTSKTLENINRFHVDTLSASELQKLQSQKKKSDCIIIEMVDFDEYAAYRNARQFIQTVLSLHNLNQHDSKLTFPNAALVEEESESFSTVIHSNINLMKRRGNTPYLHALYNDVILLNLLKLPNSFLKAISLHNVAIDCKDASNQLLNLWTIIEVLITTKRDNEDRINTICNILGAVLNRNYIYSLVEQLLKDIKNCLKMDQLDEVNKIDDSKLDDVEKFTMILALDTYQQEREEISAKLVEYPLLSHRIEFFSKIIFSNTESLYNYIYRHTKKIHWHIMRIYRNRNMIVHNGSSMPYRDLLVENLHFYVDSLLETLMQYYLRGYRNNNNIYRDIMISENSHYLKLGLPILNKKEKFNSKSFTEENVIELVYNGFNGNQLKKIIENIINDDPSEIDCDEA